jgi:predicted transcriptional regulator YheO
MVSQELLVSFCSFVSQILGPDAEVVLHDAQTGRIVWINDHALSRRGKGDLLSPSLLALLDSKCRKEQTDCLIGGMSRTENDSLLRTSNLMIRDEGELRYVVCINQDVTDLDRIKGLLERMIPSQPTAPGAKTAQVTEQTDIEEIMTNIILEEVNHADVFHFEGKKAKLAILSRLESRGVFKVKQAIPKVCQLLDIAPPTLYKYLKQLERQEGR